MSGIFKPLVFIPLSLVLFFAGFFTGKQTSSKEAISPFTETRSQGDYQFINPLLECEQANFTTNKNLDDLRKKIEIYLQEQTHTNRTSFASVYYRDLNNGPWFGINEKSDFSPASLIKVPLMMTYYKLAESDPSILQKNISTSTNLNYAEQNITPIVTLSPQHEYTVNDLINRMIIYSDNQAYNLLLDNVNPHSLASTYLDLGVNIDTEDANHDGNILSVKSYASFFRILYNSSYLSRAMSEKALKTLSKVEYPSGLVAGIPKDLVISHKFGERSYNDNGEKQLHDCGIIYLPQKPYLLCVMTRGQNFDQLSSIIKNISQAVYHGLTTN